MAHYKDEQSVVRL